jgi:hypothetical protein
MNNSWQHVRALWRAAGDKPRPSRDVVRVLRRHFAEDGIVERMARFEDFMQATNREPHVWGVSDCSLLVADWVVASGYPDPAAELRGAYATEAECGALLAARGGLSEVVAACALSSGLKPIHEPEFGCVAVIGSISRPERQWSAIWNGHFWMVRWLSKDGPTWATFAAPAIGMWSVDDGRV